jgi:hypothetical protein
LNILKLSGAATRSRTWQRGQFSIAAALLALNELPQRSHMNI